MTLVSLSFTGSGSSGTSVVVGVGEAVDELYVSVEELDCVFEDVVRDEVVDETSDEVSDEVVDSELVWLELVVVEDDANDPIVVGVASVIGDSVKLTSIVLTLSAAEAPSADI